MKTKQQQLKGILAEAGERGLCAFLKANPYILINSLNHLGHPVRVISEFPLGTEYYSDFLIIAPFSGAMELHFIEVEPPSCNFFNKDGSLSKRANKALEQVNSWRTYIEKNRGQLVRDLARYAREKDLIKARAEEERLTCTAGWDVSDLRMTFNFSFEILMGRRGLLSPEMMEKKAGFLKNNNVSLVTCDRLLEGASRIDANPGLYR